MSITPRQWVLASALGATVAATVWLATQPEDDTPAVAAAPVRRPPPAGAASSSAVASGPASASASAASAAALPGRAPWAEVSSAQLAAWQPPPPPPPPPAPPPAVAPPPPPPVAPPAPYQMIGRVVEGEGTRAVQVALLAGANKALSAKAGDVLDGQWRVEQVSDSGVRLTWLPGSLPQTIVFKAVP